MEYKRLGNSGLKVSRICLGMMTYGKTGTTGWPDWVLGEDEARPFVKKALELGINFFDTANGYSAGTSEEILGAAIRDYSSRDEVVIGTKCFLPMGGPYKPSPIPNTSGLSRKHIMSAVDASLKRLGTNYIDLYQIHRWDPNTPIEETLEALDDLVRAGKVHYIGASSMYAWQLQKALAISEKRGLTKFISMQDHYNLVYREEEREMIPCCVDNGIGVIPWSPLARGLLAGTRPRITKEQLQEMKTQGGAATNRFQTDEAAHYMYIANNAQNNFDIVDRVVDLAAKKDVKPAQIALAWLLNKPNVVAPIVGATKMSHLEDAVGAVKIKLSPEEMKYLEEIYEPHPVLGGLSS